MVYRGSKCLSEHEQETQAIPEEIPRVIRGRVGRVSDDRDRGIWKK
jgi:hypothetical protein